MRGTRSAALLAVLAGAALWSAQAAGPREAVVGSRLERMVEAGRALNYDGTFVYRSGTTMQSLRVIHRGGAKGERSRMITLSGTMREVVRRDDVIICILPESSTVLVGKRRVHKALAGGGVVDLEEIDAGEARRYYRFALAAGERVAGRPTELIEMTPRDRFRYGYRLFVDRASGLLLKSQLVDAEGQVLEEIFFTSLRLPEEIPDALLEPELSSEGYRRVLIESEGTARPDLGSHPFVVGWVPAGFRLSNHARDVFGPGRDGVHHLVYSDGLASFSIFIEPLGRDAEEPALLGLARMGAASAYSSTTGTLQITVIGEVPVNTVEQVARSLRVP